MAKRKASRSAPSSRRRAGRSKLAQAVSIVKTMTTRGAQSASTVHAAVRRAGISTRTYRTARKMLHTVALRRSKSGRKARRGAGRWYVKRR